MSQNNFVIQDIVTHVYKEQDYHQKRVLTGTIRRLLKKVWLFCVLLVLSAGIGYFAVYLPDSIPKSENVLGSLDMLNKMPKDLNSLSDSQKKELYKKLKELQ